jgi:glycine oxidase
MPAGLGAARRFGLHIGVAGAGLLGRLLAWQLAGRGHRVTVFDPAADAQARGAAGWTAAGMLSPLAELECADERVAALGLRSLDLWADITSQLPAAIDFRRDGSLLLAHGLDFATAQRLLSLLAAKAPAGLRPEPLNKAQLTALEPDVQGPAHAWLLRGEGQIHTLQAMQALADGATERGVEWRWSHSAQQVSPGSIDGERFDWVFDVRGLGARPDLPLRGVRGEILWVHAPGLTLRRPLRLLHPRSRVYLVPRPGNIVVVGASEIESEDRSPMSVRSALNLLSAAHSVLPELAEGRIVHMETNLRPALPDNLPCQESLPGLTRLNGLFRHGWLIAPAMVEDAIGALDPSRMNPQEHAA